MNNENTCCQTPETEGKLASCTQTEVRFAQPEWKADRHQAGIDLEVTLPGIRKEDLTVEVHAAQLNLVAKRPAPEKTGRLIHGRPAPEGYQLKLRLGDSLDGSALTAGLADGLLKIAIPLVESAQARKVEIN